MNVQFAVKDGTIYLIEVNPRASRTVPFVAKATDSAIASIAARLMAGEPLSNFPLRAPYPPGTSPDDPLPLADPMTLADPAMPWFSVKEAVLPFARFPGVDTLLGPEMRSTGEVMGWDRSFPQAFLKAQLGAGTDLPTSGAVFISIKDADKTPDLIETARILTSLGFTLTATGGTAAFLSRGRVRDHSDQESLRGSAQRRRSAERRRHRPGAEHHRGRAGGRGLPLHAQRRPDGQDPLLHDPGRVLCSSAGDAGAAGGGDQGAEVAGVNGY